MIALRPVVKIGNKEIEVEVISINKERRLIDLTCQPESYSIFETWRAIALAHHKSDDYLKENICMDIKIGDEVFNGCQVIKCESHPLSRNHYVVIIGFDSFTTPLYPNSLNRDEVIDEMNKLFD